MLTLSTGTGKVPIKILLDAFLMPIQFRSGISTSLTTSPNHCPPRMVVMPRWFNYRAIAR